MSNISPDSHSQNKEENDTIENIINKTIEEGITAFLESAKGKDIIKDCSFEEQKRILNRIINEVAKSFDATFINLGTTIFEIMNREGIKCDVQEIKKGIINIFNSLDEKCSINKILEDSKSDKTNHFTAFLLNMKVEKYLQDYYWFFIGNLLDNSTFNQNDNDIFILRIVNRIVKDIIGDEKISLENYRSLISLVNKMIHEKIEKLEHYSFAIKTDIDDLLIKTIEKIMKNHFPLKFVEFEESLNYAMRESCFNQESIIDSIWEKYASADVSDILSIKNGETCDDNKRKSFVNEIREPLYKRLLRKYVKTKVEDCRYFFTEAMKNLNVDVREIINREAKKLGTDKVPREWILEGIGKRAIFTQDVKKDKMLYTTGKHI